VRISAGAGLLALVLLLVVAPSALAQKLRFEVTSVVAQAKVHDMAPRGKVNKGDFIDFRDLLINRRQLFGKKKGKAVGFDVGTMTYTSATQRRIDAVATFPGIGTIRFAGRFVTRKDGTTVIPVTGGTGAFQGVKGTVTITEDDNKAPNIFQLSVPHQVDVNATGVA
jgi:hypothetical protein